MKLDNFARAVAIFLLVFIPCGTAHGQRRDRTIFQFQHTAWTAKDGAPGPIWALAQTTDGFLWIATPSGLYRFDGLQFELYQPPSGQHLLSNAIISLLATPDGGLWIGHTYGGADFLKNDRIISYGESKGLPNASVARFALDKDGVVWAISQVGLYKFDGSRWLTIGTDSGLPPGNRGSVLFVDREGTLWVVSKDALFFLSRGKHQFRKYVEHLGHTSSIGQTPDGTLWLAESMRGDPGPAWTVRTIRPAPVLPAADSRALPPVMEIDSVTSCFIDHAGSLWIASTDGLFRIPYPERLETGRPLLLDDHTAQQFRQKDGLTGDQGQVFAEDTQGDIWFGTGAGLDRFREANVVPVPATHFPRPLLVAGNHEDAWTWDQNFPKTWLVDLRGLTTSILPIQAIPTTAYRDKNGVIWLGEPKGLWKFENGRLVHYPLPEEAGKANVHDFQAITADASGGLWASIMNQDPYHWANGVWSRYGNRKDLPDETAASLFTDSAGRIWLGYQNRGVIVLDGDHSKAFSSKDGLDVKFIQAFYERAGHIWIGGDHGLALYRGNRFQMLTPAGNIEFTGVSGIVETSNGTLWLNTALGILRVSAPEIERAIREPSYHVQCERFGVLDGLTGKATQLRPIPTEVESSDGRLWFSTSTGIFQIDPNHLLRNTLAPVVEIRSLDSGGVTHQGSGAVNLPARSTNVHIEFVAPNLSIPERVRYRYILDGQDKSWQDAGTRREAFYTNLRPGHYRFRVIACNEDGVWNDVGAVAEFVVAPAWFQTYWFFALCVGAAFVALWLLYRMRVRQVAHAMSARFDERLSERTRVARELHDTLLQSVQASKYVADSALRRSTEASPMRDSMEELSVWLGHAIDEGRAAVNSLRTSTTERNDLADAFRRSIEECNVHSSVEASFSVDGEANEMHPIGREEIYRIGYEAIHNACVHSGATHLQVELKYGEDLILIVRDNGSGIDPAIVDEGKQGHFGLQGMRERASRIRAKLTVETSAGSGTEIKLFVPGGIIFQRTTSGRPKMTLIKSLLERIGFISNSTDF